MKRLIGVLLVLAVSSATVFAEAASVLQSFDTAGTVLTAQAADASSGAGTGVVSATQADTDDLFASVDAVALADAETSEVQGSGWGIVLFIIYFLVAVPLL